MRSIIRIEVFISVNLKVFLLKSVCADGQFGMNCSNHCTGHCENNEPCDHVSGVCPGGCQDGFTDQYCNSCKKPKFVF